MLAQPMTYKDMVSIYGEEAASDCLEAMEQMVSGQNELQQEDKETRLRQALKALNVFTKMT